MPDMQESSTNAHSPSPEQGTPGSQDCEWKQPSAPDGLAAGEFKMPPMAGYDCPPAEAEMKWYREAYLPRGAVMRQLSFRSLFLGSIMGAIMAIPNIYMGMKSGVLMGVSMTCTLMAYMVWNTLLKMRLVRGQMTVLEYNAMASTASSAGYTTVGGLVSAVAAFILINDRQVPLVPLFLWTLCIALLGVTMAIPFKRRFLNLEQLTFPGAIASAEAYELLCAQGSKGMRSGVALLLAAMGSTFYGLWNGMGELARGFTNWGLGKCSLAASNLAHWSPGEVSARISKSVLDPIWYNRGVSCTFDLLFLVSGCFMGLRSTSVMFAAACMCWLMWVPTLEHFGMVATKTGLAPVYSDYIGYTLWFGASALVVSGLLTVAFMSYDAARNALKRRAARASGATLPTGDMPPEIKAIETPMAWCYAGQAVTGGALVWVAHATFGIVWWQTLLAIALSFVLAIVSTRIYGQTGLSAYSSMAKVTQLTFGTLNPVSEGMTGPQKATMLNANLMTAAITTGSACNASDLMGDLKIGYYLGAHPYKQFLAQFAGVFIGALTSVVCFYALVPGKATIEGEKALAVMVSDTPVFLPDSLRPAGPADDAVGKPLKVTDAFLGEIRKAVPEAATVVGQELPIVNALRTEPKFAAPSAFAWKGVAEVVAKGMGRMELGKKAGLIMGAVLGFLLTAWVRAFPGHARYVPSAGVVGLGFIFQWWMCAMMFLGALLSEGWRRRNAKSHEEMMVPVASGLFVGAPLIAALITFVVNGAEIGQSLANSFSAMFR